MAEGLPCSSPTSTRMKEEDRRLKPEPANACREHNGFLVQSLTSASGDSAY